MAWTANTSTVCGHGDRQSEGPGTPGPQLVEKLDKLQKGEQPRTAVPDGPIPPLGHPLDKI